ncbi:amidohydrolase family protein, partial [bacterium]|nr:amidohydrolase family protein [bacterium]
PLDDGAVIVAGDRVVSVGRTADLRATHRGPCRDLGEVLLLPGLINAHCHLDYTGMQDEVEWRGSFIQWVLQLVALKKLRSQAEYIQDILAGLRQLAASGTTTVVNAASFFGCIDPVVEAQATQPGLGLRVIWCLELIDLGRSRTVEELFAEAEQFVDSRPALAGRYGFAPHAPYTVSSGLYLAAGRAANARQVPLTTHLAESTEEDDMFRRGTGPMYDYFVRAGRDMGDCKRVGVVQLLIEAGALGPRTLAVHANCLTPADILKLKESGAHVVHCPRSHRFFGRDTPLFASLSERQINVCLGTDSLASNDRLDLFAEMQTMAHVFPRMSAEELLQMVTLAPARALAQEGKLGCLAPDAAADLIAVSGGSGLPDAYEAAVWNENSVVFSMVNGKVVVG